MEEFKSITSPKHSPAEDHQKSIFITSAGNGQNETED